MSGEPAPLKGSGPSASHARARTSVVPLKDARCASTAWQLGQPEPPYRVQDDQTVIVDPTTHRIGSTWLNRGLHLVGAWLTHSHWDHTKVSKKPLSEVEDSKSSCMRQNLSGLGGAAPERSTAHPMWPRPSTLAPDEAVRTPGHTPGHLTLATASLFLATACSWDDAVGPICMERPCGPARVVVVPPEQDAGFAGRLGGAAGPYDWPTGACLISHWPMFSQGTSHGCARSDEAGRLALPRLRRAWRAVP